MTREAELQERDRRGTQWTETQWAEWHAIVGPDLVGGYAQVVYISQEDRERNLRVYALQAPPESPWRDEIPAVASVQPCQP